MNRPNLQSRPPVRRSARPAGRPAFTLIELLIVIALIVLALAMATAAFFAIFNGRNIESAENQVSAYLADARSQAVGIQEARGVLFFKDPATGRLTLVQVYYPSLYQPEGGPVQNLELVGNRDEMVLPKGVGVRGVDNNPANSANYEAWPSYCVIMFDGNGKLLFDRTTIVKSQVYPVPDPANPANTIKKTYTFELFKRLSTVEDRPVNLKPGVDIPSADALSNIGFVLYDQSVHDDLPDAGKRAWLTDNAIPYLVNRYNGTLMKGGGE